MKEGIHFPERRIVRARVALHLLAMVLLPDGTDRRYRVSTNLPKDVRITAIMPSNEHLDVYWLMLESDEFEPVPCLVQIPEITITMNSEMIGQECCAECGGIYSRPPGWEGAGCPFCDLESIRG